MKHRGMMLIAGAFVASCVVAGGASAQGLSMQDCSAKYNAAKAANTLAGKSWNDFRKAECATAAAAPAAPAAATPKTQPAATAKAQPATSGAAVFPRAVNAKYASEKAAKQRMKTCLDQYNENKANGGNGDLKWIQKGGGYYSQCNARLKGQSGA